MLFKEFFKTVKEGKSTTVSKSSTIYILNEEKFNQLKKHVDMVENLEIPYRNKLFCEECKDERFQLLHKFIKKNEEGEKEEAALLIKKIPKRAQPICKQCHNEAVILLKHVVEILPEINYSDFYTTSKAAYAFNKVVAGDEIDSYNILNSKVRIIQTPEGIKYYDMETLNQTMGNKERQVIADITQIMKTKGTQIEESYQIIKETCENKNLDPIKIQKFFNDYYLKLGDLQYLIQDESITDIFVFANGRVSLSHQNYGLMECTLCFTPVGLKSLSLAYERISGKPFSYTSPYSVFYWDDENVRISIVGYVANYTSMPELAIRKFPTYPWSILELIKRGSLNCEMAAMLNIFVYSGASIIIGGDKGGGKSTLMQSFLYMIPKLDRKLAILTDREIHKWFYENDFRISELRVHSGDETSAQGIPIKDAVSFMLIFGDSRLTIFNEIKYVEEARPFFGTTAVAGVNSIVTTIHAGSSEGILHRLIYSFDLDPEAIRNIDFIVMALPEKDLKGNIKRMVSRVTEIQKFKRNPLEEEKLVDIAKYNKIKEKWHIDLENSIFITKIEERFGLTKKEVLKLHHDLTTFYELMYKEHIKGKIDNLKLAYYVEQFFKEWKP